MFKSRAIANLRPGAKWVLNGEELVWLDTEQSIPTEEEIYSESQRILENYQSNEYKRLRKLEYDGLNQFEMMFDDQVNGTTTWVDAINAIKAKYPKP